MNITIISLGTRGDVQPYIALGLGLKKAGHNVKLATHGEFSSFVIAYGLDFSPVEGNIQALLEGDAGKGILGSGNNKFDFFRHFAVLARPLMKNILVDSWKACQGADVILNSLFGLFAAKSIAERLGIPYYPAMIFPETPTNVFAHNLFPPEIRLGPIYNRLTYSIVEGAFWYLFRNTFNDIRKEVLDLPPIKKNPFRQMRKERVPVLYGYSASILPRPKDWKDWIHVTGYWFLDSQNVWQPPEDLVDFLKSGTKPVYIGFGSMSNRDPEKTTGTVIKALQIAKQRGIITSGWGGACEEQSTRRGVSYRFHPPRLAVSANVCCCPSRWSRNDRRGSPCGLSDRCYPVFCRPAFLGAMCLRSRGGTQTHSTA